MNRPVTSEAPRGLSLTGYIAVGILMVALVFAGLGGFLTLQMNQVESELQARARNAAEQELREAWMQVGLTLGAQAMALTEWEEVRQQLRNPAYYDYWLHHRARAPGQVPAFVAELALYDRAGRRLPGGDAGTGLPGVVPDDETGKAWLVAADGRFLLRCFEPVHVANGAARGERLMGWLGVAADPLALLKATARLRHIDPDSLSFSVPAAGRIRFEDALDRIDYRVRPDSDAQGLIDLFRRFLWQAGAVLLLLSLLLYSLSATAVAMPLRQLARRIDAMRRGEPPDFDRRVSQPLPIREIDTITRSLTDYQQALDLAHQDLDDKNRALWELAHKDSLTGVFNRRGFDQAWRELLGGEGAVERITYMQFDCDNFKAINDTYGHGTGDRVIRRMAELIQHALRQGDHLYRLGGDEFGALFADLPMQRALAIAHRCQQEVAACDFTALGVREPVTVSIGVAEADADDPEAVQSLHRRADIAMYHAKRPGYSKVVTYEPGMERASAPASSRKSGAVRRALANPELMEMHFQPVVDLVSGAVSSYEALVRVRDGDELLMPADILPVIEARRLQLELDLAVIERIGAALEAGELAADAGLSINLSGISLMLPEAVDALVRLRRRAGERTLVVELTESALVQRIGQAREHLLELRQAGYRIALDDFGSGYSSLKYLATMPVDIVKFDYGMTHALETEGLQGEIVESLAANIRQAGYAVVAEGIEQPSQLRRVMDCGFTHAQGFLLGRPDTGLAAPPDLRRYRIKAVY